ncbi:MAG: hypothetical protein ACPGPE_05380 [Planctomycetota bacterium]
MRHVSNPGRTRLLAGAIALLCAASLLWVRPWPGIEQEAGIQLVARESDSDAESSGPRADLSGVGGDEARAG